MKKLNALDIAKDCLGVRYRHQGRTKLGMDCVGLVYYVFDQLTEIPEYVSNYKRVPTNNEILDYMQSNSTEIDSPEPGCVVIFARGRVYFHAAIVCSKDTVIHSVQNHGQDQGGVRYCNWNEERKWSKLERRYFHLEL